METKTICGQRSWRVSSDRVEAYVTETGGHMAPVTFDLGGKKVQPFLVAPWGEEQLAPDTDDVLKVLRGDFFCMPFGGQFMPPDGFSYPLHGESATRRWSLDGVTRLGSSTTLRASMDWSIRPGHVTKSIKLVDGESAVYSRHVVEGVAGGFSYGLHPTLLLPDEEGCAYVSVAPFEMGEVSPFPFENPAEKGYQSLKIGALFGSLNKVPRIDGSTADLTRYPARRGFEDFVMMKTREDLPFGWAAVSVPSRGYLWLSLKDRRVLPVSLMWMSNGGRYYAPWNGRNVNVLGMEEAAVHLPLGPADTALQSLSEVPQLSSGMPLVVNTIIAVIAIPENFQRVVDVKKVAGGVRAISDSGRSVDVALDLGFLFQSG